MNLTDLNVAPTNADVQLPQCHFAKRMLPANTET